MKRLSFALLVLILLPAALFAQRNDTISKFALVIGNGNYTGLGRLANPVNDANDISAVLEQLGFSVEKILNGNQEQMENAITRLKKRLGGAEKSYGFFFYAGHGVQSGGENFLIPVDANIPGENYLRNRAVSVQTLLDDLNDAGNSLNVVVLDACRDNPFGWSRSGSRGLSVVSRQPADSIIVYATSAGARASDGDGRNGLFTGQLINNLATPGLEVKEIFNRTGADVAAVSDRQQIPAIYNQFFGTAYLGDWPEGINPAPWQPAYPPPSSGRGSGKNSARLYAGLRAGLSPHLWKLSNDISGNVENPSLGIEPAIHGAFYFTGLIAMQAELALSRDRVSYSGGEGSSAYTGSFESYSLQMPLLIRLTYRPGIFSLSGFGGIKINIPLGDMKLNSNLFGTNSYRFSIPPAYVAGVNLGMKLGPGILFSDIRFSGDFTTTAIHDDYGTMALYSRKTLSFSLGYEMGFFYR